MNLAKFLIILPFSLTTACVSMSDFEKSQTQLLENSKKQKVFSNAKDAGIATKDNCLKPSGYGKWEVVISHDDKMVKQGENGVGYFKTLCFSKAQEHNELSIVGIHAGGGMGKAFFLLPRISIFDERWNLVAQNLSQIRQNAFSGNLEAKMDLSKVKSGNHFLVIEGDNRSGKSGIGEYAQRTYAVVPIITSVEMFSLPTGKARLQLNQKK